MPPPAGSLLKLFAATNVMRRSEIGLELAGADGRHLARRRRHAGRAGSASFTLWRQGTVARRRVSNEIQRNIISERLLGMPREYAADRDVPYREVRRGGSRS